MALVACGRLRGRQEKSLCLRLDYVGKKPAEKCYSQAEREFNTTRNTKTRRTGENVRHCTSGGCLKIR